ncbi:MAG: DUF262 domain-containing protein [Verrucomicrobiae bacterium]|nr:DUF262 domain-containing protein [Verrucomicrobiae bacterium]
MKYDYKGIGELIIRGRLRVPPNQREYSWEPEHAEDLCHDLGEALRTNEDSYFLGTIVLTNANGVMEVVDGQQRLATVSMIVACIRDLFLETGDEVLAASVENQFLFRVDFGTEDVQANLILNTRDHHFFLTHVLQRNSENAPANSGIAASTARIRSCSRIVREFMAKRIGHLKEAARKEELKAWLSLIEDRAKVIVLEASDDANAYMMFETLNDRGLKVSKADLVKNYLFGKSGSRINESKDHWYSMVSALEVSGVDDSIIDYLRYLCTISYGLTRERELFKQIRSHASSQSGVIVFGSQMKHMATDFAAIMSPEHSKWNSYPSTVRRSLLTLTVFDVTQIRHLVLAVAHYFAPKEADLAFRMFVSWIVRLIIGSSGKVGRVEDTYAKLAHRIHADKSFRSAHALNREIRPSLATDDEFRTAFAVARVSKPKLARYYLDSLERQLTGEDTPELVPNDDVLSVNLEHVVPKNPTGRWGSLSLEEAAVLTSRLGNLALMKRESNEEAGNSSFEEKKSYYRNSAFKFTEKIADYDEWNGESVSERQNVMADVAVRCWPLKFAK